MCRYASKLWWHPYCVGDDSSKDAYIEALRHATSRENIDFSTNQGHDVRLNNPIRARTSAQVFQRYEAIEGRIALLLCSRGSVLKRDDVRECHYWREGIRWSSSAGRVGRFISVSRSTARASNPGFYQLPSSSTQWPNRTQQDPWVDKFHKSLARTVRQTAIEFQPTIHSASSA